MKIGISYADRVCFLGTLKQDERAIASARSMQYTHLGSTGMQVSRICLGTMSFGNSEEWMVEIDKARPIVQRALDLGLNFFDTANLYSNGRSEEIVGELLKDHRDDVVIALNDLVRQGTIGYIGASSMWAWQLAKALFTSDSLGIARFVSMQNHYNLCYREEERE